MKKPAAEFDAYAEDYDEALNRGISVSGEDKHYFAEGRVAWLPRILGGQAPQRALDFGCGTGGSIPWLFKLPGLRAVTGVDVSAASLATAAREVNDPRASFQTLAEFSAEAAFDLAFCNGVFHHIPPAERAAALKTIYRALVPDGFFAFWENNPWNPGTRFVMSRIPFDRDAVLITPPAARRLLRAAGFAIERTDFLFVFPRVLRALRRLEPALSALPLGAQYLVLARKP